MTGLDEHLELSAETYSQQLRLVTSPHSLIDYLRGHALARTDIIDKYRLGYVSEPLLGDEQFRGMLAIPYLTQAGVRSMKYRCVLDHACNDLSHAKYAQPTGQRQRLFNTAAYFTEGDIVGICEGEVDAITLTEHINIPTLGVPGASQWSKSGAYWKLALKDFEAVLIFADGDEPGLNLAKQIAGDVGWRARVVRCDPGQDASSMIVAGETKTLLSRAGIS